MRFTPSIAYAILAFASTSYATPMSTTTTAAGSRSTGTTGPGYNTNSTQPGGSNPNPNPPSPGNAPVTVTLSKTQQLFLADTAADRFALLPNDQKDFVFSFNTPQVNPGKGGNLVAANRKNFPALVGTSLGMAVGKVGPCGMNTLHVHPRGAELQLVVKGRLITEMVPENGVLVKDPKDPSKMIRRVIKTEVKEFEATPFYQGSIHTQFNPDCTEAVFVAAFPTDDFGTGQIADETFALTDDVIGATFGQSIRGEDIERVRKAIPVNIARGVDKCLKECRITKRAF